MGKYAARVRVLKKKEKKKLLVGETAAVRGAFKDKFKDDRLVAPADCHLVQMPLCEVLPSHSNVQVHHA